MRSKWFMEHVVNPFMKWLLQSPLHRFVSSRVLLIIVTGRKSGNRYTTPVEYLQQGNTALIVSSEKYNWWKNLHDGGKATLVLHGKTLEGLATTSTDRAEVRQSLQTLYPRMNPTQIEQIAPGCVVIRVQF
ncbi:MAG TPA: nitroreductase family deazaflavin-dependent oxidoreductase [Phototrophicaceae bacterium]|jgi:deazaflavin-dependent oxidoreductase (nitroreductase family)|nr:nitroreductase family deazaflavin-dependent oxidoreductase [Phototrophicaceae bacterium]